MNGIKPYGIKTDSLLVDAREEKKVMTLFDFSRRIGGLKIEYDKSICDKYIEMKNHSITENNERKVITYELKSEENFFNDPDSYNNEIRGILKKHNLVMIWSVYAGGGKSFASSLTGKNILYVTPYNQLCQELVIKGFKAITLHNLMSLNMTGQVSKRKKFDVSQFDTIVFEEILLYDPQLLSSIQRFIKLHPDKKIIANGDDSQNLPLNFDFNNIATKNKYLVDCIMSMFDAHIILRMNKRLKDPKDREKLVSLKNDVFDLNVEIMEVFKRYNFRIMDNMSELKTLDSISYFRSRSYKINQHVQAQLVDVPSQCIDFSHIHNNKSYNSNIMSVNISSVGNPSIENIIFKAH